MKSLFNADGVNPCNEDSRAFFISVGETKTSKVRGHWGHDLQLRSWLLCDYWRSTQTRMLFFTGCLDSGCIGNSLKKKIRLKGYVILSSGLE